MKHLSRKVLSFAVGLILAGGMLAQEAIPAMAAGGKLFVGTCGKQHYADIQSAVAAAELLPPNTHKTITICPGTHLVTTAVNITTNRLRIVGKKGAMIVTPAAYAGSVFNVSNSDRFVLQKVAITTGSGFNGVLIEVSNSTNARIQRVTIDGQGTLAGGIGIYLFSASGNVIGNKVLNWHTPTYTGGGLLALGAQGSSVEKVSFKSNTVDDYQNIAIWSVSVPSLTVTGNKVNGPNAGLFSSGVYVSDMTSGRISGNRVTGGAYPTVGNTAGIVMVNTSNIKTSGNKLSHWDTGIQFSAAGCPVFPVNNNRIAGNRIQDVFRGIFMDSLATASCDAHADHNVITGNKILDTGAPGPIAIELYTTTVSGHFGYLLDETVKGNTITNFTVPMTSPLPDPANNITGVFGPNKVH